MQWDSAATTVVVGHIGVLLRPGLDARSVLEIPGPNEKTDDGFPTLQKYTFTCVYISCNILIFNKKNALKCLIC